MAKYPNLPGVEVEVQDGGLILPQDSSTESMLVIAPCTGSVEVPEEPKLIRNTSELKENFGDFVDSNGSTVNPIAAAWKAAYEGGNRSIYLMALEGTTDKEKFEKLHEAFFGILEDFEVDHIVVQGVYADQEVELSSGDLGTSSDDELASIEGVVVVNDEGGTAAYKGNFAKLLSAYCEMQTINVSDVVGYIGTTAPVSNSLKDVRDQIEKLTALDNEYSGYVSVIAGPELGYQVPGKSGPHYENGAVTYAALVSTLRPESAPTNKPVAGVTGPNYKLSLKQLNTLTAKRYVTFRLKDNQVYVTDGITTAPKMTIGGVTQDSDFTRLSTLRIVHAAMGLIREISDPFIGEPAGIPQRNALQAAIKSGLEAMRTRGAIVDYNFTLVQEGSSIGQTRISLQLVPALETKKINVVISLANEIN